MIVDFNIVNEISTIREKNKKLDEYLIKCDIEFYYIPSISRFGLDRFLINNIDIEQFEEIFSFITKELKTNPKSIHLPYQTLSVNGEGNIETIDEIQTTDINQFVQTKYNKKLELPSILVIDQNKYVKAKWDANLIAVKCVFCHNLAEYVLSGFSVCRIHFVKLKAENKKEADRLKKKEKELQKTAQKNREAMEKSTEAMEKLEKTLRQKPKPREKEMYR